MADLKITQLAQLNAIPAANDVIPIVDVSDTSMAASGTTKKIAANRIVATDGNAAVVTGGGTVALGGNSLTVTGGNPTLRDGGTLDLNGNTLSLTGGNVTLTDSGTLDLNGYTATVPGTGTLALRDVTNSFGAIHTISQSISDDSVLSFVPAAGWGMLFITGAALGHNGVFAFRCSAGSEYCGVVTQFSTLFDTTTGVLTGTTGTDGKITVSAAVSTGRVYIENRSGASRSLQVLVIGA